MSTISRSQIVEYILYTLQHGSENLTRENAYNFLRTLYAERNIAIDEDFTSEMLALKDLYKSITKIYKQDPKKIDQFLKATQKSIKENKDETFEGFPYQSIFQDFYKSVRRAMGNLIAYNKIIEESLEIKRKSDEAKKLAEQVRREKELRENEEARQRYQRKKEQEQKEAEERAKIFEEERRRENEEFLKKAQGKYPFPNDISGKYNFSQKSEEQKQREKILEDNRRKVQEAEEKKRRDDKIYEEAMEFLRKRQQEREEQQRREQKEKEIGSKEYQEKMERERKRKEAEEAYKKFREDMEDARSGMENLSIFGNNETLKMRFKYMREPEKQKIRDAIKYFNLTSSSFNSRDINKMFRIKSLQHHPDKGGNQDEYKKIVNYRDALIKLIEQ